MIYYLYPEFSIYTPQLLDTEEFVLSCIKKPELYRQGYIEITGTEALDKAYLRHRANRRWSAELTSILINMGLNPSILEYLLAAHYGKPLYLTSVLAEGESIRVSHPVEGAVRLKALSDGDIYGRYEPSYVVYDMERFHASRRDIAYEDEFGNPVFFEFVYEEMSEIGIKLALKGYYLVFDYAEGCKA